MNHLLKKIPQVKIPTLDKAEAYQICNENRDVKQTKTKYGF